MTETENTQTTAASPTHYLPPDPVRLAAGQTSDTATSDLGTTPEGVEIISRRTLANGSVLEQLGASLEGAD